MQVSLYLLDQECRESKEHWSIKDMKWSKALREVLGQTKERPKLKGTYQEGKEPKRE